MSQQVQMQDPSDRRTDTVVISPTALTEDLPRAVRGYAVEAVDRLVAELESNLNAFRNKATKLEEERRKIGEDLARCAKELASFREKESTLLAALLSMEERKQTFRGEVESSIEQAKIEAKELKERAQLEAARYRGETEKIVSEARAEATHILESAREEAELIKSRAYSDVDGIAAEAQVQKDNILSEAFVEADKIAKKAREDVSRAEGHMKRLKSEFQQTVKTIRQVVSAQLDALPADFENEAEFAAPTQNGAAEPVISLDDGA
jgi:cell division septum initiation protein DivIVA